MYTLDKSSQSIKALCFTLLELSILNLLHRASKLILDPGNLFLAISNVSTTFAIDIFSFFIMDNSLFKWAMSNSALWITIFFPSIKFKNSSATSLNNFLSERNSSE